MKDKLTCRGLAVRGKRMRIEQGTGEQDLKPIHLRLGIPGPFISADRGVNEVCEGDEAAWTRMEGWMVGYERRRGRARRGRQEVQEYTDRWMAAWEGGEVSPLPQDPRDAPSVDATHQDPSDEDGGGWTVVARGGHHGRSAIDSTIPSQPTRPDPYAQSSMADRDAHAAVKVMKRTFHKSLSTDFQQSPDNPLSKKRKGGQLDTGFYRTTNPKHHKKNCEVSPPAFYVYKIA
ncbi:uncharacterized protein VP01_1652g6 [Puccinia sorghi]|uniref:Uncharacterized protein n=1 Tax=Puccinia sorghi TaxID=27349 RepID=A0A0L6VGG7_9BASI|nr:uncharacterized protein VP01_1652g6 [Puccinia sorghi]